MPTRRVDCAAGMCGNKIYVIGGANFWEENFLSSVDVFETDTNSWNATTKIVPDMHDGAKSGLSVLVVDHFVIVMSGHKSPTMSSFKILDTQLNVWNNARIPLNETRLSLAAGIWKNDDVGKIEVIVAGGINFRGPILKAEEMISFQDGILPADYSVEERKDEFGRNERYYHFRKDQDLKRDSDHGIDLLFLNEYYHFIKDQDLKSDSDHGKDLLDLNVIARIFAGHLASKSLIPPFVLGILGNWGSGKTFFFNLIKDHLIKIQIKKNKEEAGYVDRMYLIRFSAWTYSKDDLWASMMFRIFRDLSCQMELEEKINGKGISVMELYDKLSSSGEQKYIKKLEVKNDSKFVKELRKIKRNENKASEPFAAIFKDQMEDDRIDLKVVEEKLNEEAKQNVWERAIKDYKEGMDDRLPNAFRDKVVETMKAQKEQIEKFDKINFDELSTEDLKEHISILDFWTRLSIRIKICYQPSDAIKKHISQKLKTHKQDQKDIYQNRLKKGLEENFSGLGPLIRLLVSVKNSPSLFLFLVILIIALVLAMIYFQEEIKIRWKAFTASFVAFLAPILQFRIKMKESLTKFSNEHSKEIKQVTNYVSDIEADLTSSSDEPIQTSKKKIRHIKNRLKVVEGESLQQLVNDRVKSNFYLEQLGILHQAQEDLFKLSDAMHNKYEKENQEARIVLFIDDLDRCEPGKVIEVLEAMHLLVNTKLFVVVVTIDSRYVCLSLENINKYKDILHNDRSPTGMDFLEKIIQVPFRLPAMSNAAIDNFVEHHVRGDEDDEDDNDNNINDNDNNNIDININIDNNDNNNNNNDIDNNNNIDIDIDKNVVVKKQTISKDGLKDLKDVCYVFQMGPRKLKYLINVYNLMSRIWKEEIRKRNGMWKGRHVGRISLFIIAMASCENTREGIEELFNAMLSKDNIMFATENFEERNLGDFVCKLCPKLELSPHKKIIQVEFNVFPMASREDWSDFCRHFELARCFSFDHITDDAVFDPRRASGRACADSGRPRS